LFKQIGGGRSLGYEGERSICINRDHNRDGHIAGTGRLGVERLAELHDVETVLAECRTDRRRRIRPSGRDLQPYICGYLLCHLRVVCEPACAETLPFP